MTNADKRRILARESVSFPDISLCGSAKLGSKQAKVGFDARHFREIARHALIACHIQISWRKKKPAMSCDMRAEFTAKRADFLVAVNPFKHVGHHMHVGIARMIQAR